MSKQKKSTATLKVMGIKWDTDGVSARKLGLPKNVTIELTFAEYADIQCGDPDIVADKLSDKYGYCVLSYENDYLVPEN